MDIIAFYLGQIINPQTCTFTKKKHLVFSNCAFVLWHIKFYTAVYLPLDKLSR